MEVGLGRSLAQAPQPGLDAGRGQVLDLTVVSVQPGVFAHLRQGQLAQSVDPGIHGGKGSVGRVAPPRYRCGACGNLTRFDVTVTRRTRSFHHYTVGGELAVEDEEVLDEVVEDVTCRWCGSGSAVEVVTADSQV
jgi:hypothetical protein